MASFLLLVFLFPLTQAQFGLFPGFGFPQPPPPPNPWANLFSNPFQPFQQQTTPATTTQLAIENVPNPDLERGNFPAPDPRMWPIGPDWNDPRNTWTSELGWGGRDVGRAFTQSTRALSTAPIISTTAVPLNTSEEPEVSTDNSILSAASSTQISPIIRPFSQLTPDVKQKKMEKEVEDDIVSSTKIPKILGEDSVRLSQMTSRQLESDRLVRHRSTSQKRH
ncbi:unnamed protein product [Auanema sp. JU1783]|nr:unnamed protein product [Auanema sp. JU1783]